MKSLALKQIKIVYDIVSAFIDICYIPLQEEPVILDTMRILKEHIRTAGTKIEALVKKES